MEPVFRQDFNNLLKKVTSDNIISKTELGLLKSSAYTQEEKYFSNALESQGDNVRVKFKVNEMGINPVDYNIQLRLTDDANLNDSKYEFSSIIATFSNEPIVVPPHKDNPEGVMVNEQVYKDFPNLKILDGHLKIEDYDNYFIKENIKDLSKIPDNVLHKLKDSGVKLIQIGNIPVTEMKDNNELISQKPRNWKDGSKWENVPGVYNPNHRTVAISVGDNGSDALALHETGHAIGDLFHLDKTKEMIEIHKKLFDKLEPYLKGGDEPGNRAGTEETFAEAFATLIKDGEQKTAERFSPEMVKYLKDNVLNVKP